MDEKEKEKLRARNLARLESAIPATSGGYSFPREIHYIPAIAPDWAYWSAEQRVQRWQAVSLSLNLDPDSLKHTDDGLGALGHGRLIPPQSFPSADIQDKFRKRIDLLGRLSEKVCAPLSEFVALLGKRDMPPELTALVAPVVTPAACIEPQKVDAGDTADSEQRAASTVAKTESQTGKPDNNSRSKGATDASNAAGAPAHKDTDASVFKGLWWWDDYDIMLYAENAGAALKRKKARTSNRAIGDAIAKRIEEEERRGQKRKPPTGDHFKNTVLKGWKYKPE